MGLLWVFLVFYYYFLLGNDSKAAFVRHHMQHFQNYFDTRVRACVSLHLRDALNCCLYFGTLLSTTCCADAQLLHVCMLIPQLEVLKDLRRFAAYSEKELCILWLGKCECCLGVESGSGVF